MKKTLIAAAALVAGLFASSVSAANLVLINTDPAGSGFNDTTPATPVGGNSGTTVGQQRLIAYQRALDLWGSVLKSTVPVRIEGSFRPLTCTAGSAVLAQAGALEIFSDFAPGVLPGHWYGGAVADAIAGVDLDPASNDIVARFNSNLGQPGCLTGSFFYYGLDNNPPAGTIDFLNTFMHEVAHGLGFQNFANESDGSTISNMPDVYMANTKDLTTGKQWNVMTPSEIVASAVNLGRVVWTGSTVNSNAPRILGPREVLRVNGGLVRDIDFGSASFGPAITKTNFTGDRYVLVNDGAGASATDGCEPIVNSVAGRVVVIDRGTCGFAVKTKNAQNAGASAVIIVNNVALAGPIALGGADASITIPAMGISLEDGRDIKTAISGAGVGGRYFSIFSQRSGMASGQTRLFAPGVVQPGSSISHFDTIANPNLLMEPSITASLRASRNIDLTPALMKDIGWQLETIRIGSCDSGVANALPSGEIFSTVVENCIATNGGADGSPRQCVRVAATNREVQGTMSADDRNNVHRCAFQLSGPG